MMNYMRFIKSKSDIERKNLDLGFTLMFNPLFTRNIKKTINHKSEIIPELFLSNILHQSFIKYKPSFNR